VKPGDEWGVPTDAEADTTVRGNDGALADALADLDARGHTDPLVRFHPEDSDLARTVGLGAPVTGRGGIALPLDRIDGDLGAVNLLVSGVRPDRLRSRHRRRRVVVEVDGRRVHDGPATSVVVANGQFLHGLDLVPRGHPGDGRLEVHVYALRAGERAAMRRRLPAGAHVPHPRIVTTTGRDVTIRWARPTPVEADGRAATTVAQVHARVRAGAYRLLV
jgi:hypothetical protein